MASKNQFKQSSDRHYSWTYGDTWPKDGELDIIEGVNRQSANKLALHTTKGCKINKTGAFTGLVQSTDCDVYSPTQPNNQGCLFDSRQANSYGTNFNTKNGGVYAIEWTSAHISVWFFPRASIPANVRSKNPDPTKWGRPVARFSGGCQIDKYVQRQKLVRRSNPSPALLTNDLKMTNCLLSSIGLQHQLLRRLG